MKRQILFFASLLLCGITAFSKDYVALPKAQELNVAIYDNGDEYKKFGVNYIYEALKNAGGIQATTIDNLQRDTLKKYDVVIISTATKLAQKDITDTDRVIKGTDWIKTLTNYVDSGGGLIIGHNAIGIRGIFGTYKLFPMIGTTSSRTLEGHYLVKDTGHPVMAGIPAKWYHGYDHMEIITGKDGKVLAEDKTGKNVIVAGDVSRGRVVQIGFPMGLWWKGKTSQLPALEQKLLLNAVKWAGAKARFDIPLQDTESGLLAETMNYKKLQEKAQLVKYEKLPMPKFDEAVIWAPAQWMGPGAMIDSQEKVANIMDNCKKMGFNKVAVIMKHGSFFYPTVLKSLDKKNDFSYGECVVEEAGKRDMKVAMIISPFVNGLQDGASWPLDTNKAEYDKIQQGKMVASDVGLATKWARKNCPDYPAVRQRALDVTAELIKKYHPDEMYLDYIRYKDGYDTSCYCDYSQKQKVAFAAKHPEVAKDKLDVEFAKSSLMAFVKEWTELCKKLDPKIKTACYTISAPECKAPAWVNQYPVDWHAKYVSRHTTGPESSLEDTEYLTKSYSKWMKSGAPVSKFSPMIAAYDPKSGERLLTEFKIVSDLQDKANVKFKRVEFYEYSQLLEGHKKDLKINQDMASGISKALGGTFAAK